MTTMTCDQCRQIIAVADLTDWNDMDGVAAHCRSCEACAVVVTDVRDSARRVADLLDGITPGVSSALVARRAAAAAALERQQRRRRLALVYPLAAAAVALPVIAFSVTRGLPGHERRHVVLQCMAPEQAASILAPILGREGSIAFSEKSPVRMVTLGGPSRVVEEAERVLAQLDNAGSPAMNGSCFTTEHDMATAQAMDQAHAMEQEVVRAHEEAARAQQEVERARQEMERARQEAEHARQDARQDARRDR